MKGRVRWVVGMAGVVAALAGAQQAAAATFCVSDAACVLAGGQDEGGDLQTALNAAKASPGPDTVRIGPGTFSAPTGFAEVGDASAVTVVGAGRGVTTLTAGAGASVLAFTDGSHLTVGGAVSNLTIAMPPSGGVGVNVPTTISHVDISGGTGAATALWTQDTTVSDVRIDLPLDGSSNEGIYRPNGTLAADGLTIRAHTAITGNGTADTYAHLRIVSDGSGIVLGGSNASMTIDDAQILMTGSGQALLWRATFGHPAALQARFLTLRGDGTAGSTGAQSTGMNAGSVATLTLENAIVTGFQHALACTVAASGTATLVARYSDFDPSGDADGCGSGVDTTTGNTSAAPLLLSAPNGDLVPPHGSPVIDAGDPALTAPTPASDLAGNARLADGNRDGTARVDMGAFEYVPAAPHLGALVAPSSVKPGVAATFSVTGASDANLGDALTYAWAFDDGAHATGPSVQHAFATPGTHVGVVTATDPLGLTGTATATLTVAPPQPVVSAFSIAPSRFAPMPRRTPHQRAPHGPHRGATFRFRLSEAATATIRIDALRSGRRLHGRCVADRRSLRRARRCERPVKVLTLRRAAKVGRTSLAFTGRAGRRALPRGRYRATIVARVTGAPDSKPRTVRFTIV